MSLRNYSRLKDIVYYYLGYKNINRDDNIDRLIDECLRELEDIARFKALFVEYDYVLDFLNKEPYLAFLKGATKYYIVAYTLGIDVDKKIKMLGVSDTVKMLVMDSCASAYLENEANEFDKSLGDDISYRFAIGYQGTSLSDLGEAKRLISLDKIGIELLDSNLMIPQKSMIGIIANNGNKKLSCGKCVLLDKCGFIREKKRCYD